MRMAIVTLGIGSRYRRLVRSGLVSKRYYARKQGIPFILAREECLDPHRPPAWSKVNAALRYLPDHDMIFLTDADVVVMNPQIDLRQIVAGEMGNADVMLTLDCNGLQFGNVFLRHTPFVLDLLQRMYRQIHLIDHKWWEQAAFIELYESDPDVRGRTVALPQQRIFNSFAPEIGGRSLRLLPSGRSSRPFSKPARELAARTQ